MIDALCEEEDGIGHTEMLRCELATIWSSADLHMTWRYLESSDVCITPTQLAQLLYTGVQVTNVSWKIDGTDYIRWSSTHLNYKWCLQANESEFFKVMSEGDAQMVLLITCAHLYEHRMFCCLACFVEETLSAICVFWRRRAGATWH